MKMVPGDKTQAVPLESAMSAADEPRALCIIRDMTNTQWQSGKVTLNLPASTTGHQLMEEVAHRCHYEINTFELILQRMPDGESIMVNNHPKHSLSEMGFRCTDSNRNNLIIGEKNGDPPRRVEVGDDNSVNLDDLSLGASASPVGTGDGDLTYENALPPPLPPPLPQNSSDYSCSYSSPIIKQDTGYVGLVNQAMTCYLNSLLQSLFMTPEFRNALYRWEFDGAEEEKSKSIPYQLQRLFLYLQTTKRHAVETTELTRSFGWDSSEAWQQHDVQELCRVMFDALEQKFRNTDQADLINRLYQGKIKDYVKCLECSYESAREDAYLDIPLPVRPFGSNQAYGSVEEALQAFVQPEVLNGSNQYFCEKCNKKCDAHKGLKFMTFPYLLTLQLKRFDFDYATMHRIKLNDKVTFQEILNLNCFIKCEHEETNDDASTTDSGSALEEDPICGQTIASLQTSSFVTSTADVQDDDEGIDMESGAGSLHNSHEVSANEKNLRHSMEKGPYLYELFSIMVHSGSANGGHYYAYIKSFKDGQWYCFNDQSVTRITYDDIRKTYGGGPTRSYYSGAYSSSTNAYMLMYRQIDKERNAETVSEDDFPTHIKTVLQTMQQQEENERKQRVMERNMCKIKLFWNNNILQRVSEVVLNLHKDTTLAETTRTAHTVLGLEGLVPLERCRLVKYDDSHDSLECSFEGSEDVPIGELLGGVKSSYRYSLLLEVWPPDKLVPIYKPGGTTVKVYAVNLDTEEVESPVTVRSYLSQTVQEFKDQVVQELGLPNKDPQIVLERYYNDLRVLADPSKTLKAEGFYRSNKVFVERSGKLDVDQGNSNAAFDRILDRYEHTVTLHVVLPDIHSELSKRLLAMSSFPGEVLEPDDAKIETPLAVEEHNGEGQGIAKSSLCDHSVYKKGEVHGHAHGDYDEGICSSEFDSNPTYQATVVHSDQSEDSSLTDSDRTIVGDSPPQNGSMVESHLHQLKSEQTFGSTNSSSDKSDSSSYVSPCEVERNLSSPEENSKEYTDKHKKEFFSKWDDGEDEFNEPKEEVKRYFRALQYTDTLTDAKMLRVHVDKRITLGALKKELELYVGVPVDCFKIFRIYSNNQEFECTRLSENLMPYSDDSQMIVKVGRALRKGEYRVKIYQFLLNEPEPSQFLIDWIFAKGMTVLQAKKEILPEVKAKCNLDIPLEKCRLRKKSWRTPSTIYIDSQKFEDEINIFDNSEVYLEIISEPEKVTSSSQLSLYVRWWHPEKIALDPMQEVVIDDYSVEQLKIKLNEISGIPIEFIDFAKVQGSFPCELSLLTLHTDLEWNPQVTNLTKWPLYICDDGFVVCFKDRREIVKQLSEDARREILTKESARLHKWGRGANSPRKEKALKIYTDSPPPRSSATSCDPELD